MYFRQSPERHADRLEIEAKSKLTENAAGYFNSGSETESSLQANQEAFGKWRLLPRVMFDVSRVDTSTTLLGKRLRWPVIAAPMAMQQLAHPDGELAMARACHQCKTTMGVSTMGTYSVKQVAAASSNPEALMFQLYVFKNRQLTQTLVQEAEQNGYGSLVVTVDAPRLGKREADRRNSFKLPKGMKLANLEGYMHEARSAEQSADADGSQLEEFFKRELDASLTWEFVTWLRGITHLPILVKGVLAPADAIAAVAAGVDGIVISNHGGRQCDGAPAALDMLPFITKALGPHRSIPLIIDGGIRRGSHIVKALALGADAVMVGRPLLWSLAIGGQDGVRKFLETLHEEFELNMVLCGCATLKDIGRDLVIGAEGLTGSQQAIAKL